MPENIFEKKKKKRRKKTGNNFEDFVQTVSINYNFGDENYDTKI